MLTTLPRMATLFDALVPLACLRHARFRGVLAVLGLLERLSQRGKQVA